MAKEDEVVGNLHLPRRASPFEWNLNSVIQVISMVTFISGLFVMSFVWGGKFTDVNRDIIDNAKDTKELAQALERHIEEGKDRIEENQATMASLRAGIEATNSAMQTLAQNLNDRIGNVANDFDDRMDSEDSAVTVLTGRMGGAEARNSEISTTLQSLQASVNDQSGNIKVITAWVEEQKRRQDAEDKKPSH